MELIAGSSTDAAAVQEACADAEAVLLRCKGGKGVLNHCSVMFKAFVVLFVCDIACPSNVTCSKMKEVPKFLAKGHVDGR